MLQHALTDRERFQFPSLASRRATTSCRPGGPKSESVFSHIVTVCVVLLKVERTCVYVCVLMPPPLLNGFWLLASRSQLIEWHQMPALLEHTHTLSVCVCVCLHYLSHLCHTHFYPRENVIGCFGLRPKTPEEPAGSVPSSHSG